VLTLPEYSIRLRRYTTPTTPAEVIRAQDITFTTVADQPAAVQLQVSQLVAGTLPTPFYGGVEIRNPATGQWVKPWNDLHVFHDDEDDEKDPSRIHSYTGVLFVADRAGVHHIDPGVTSDGSITWVNASAGAVMADLFTREPNTGITRTFTPAVDSDGRAWPTGDKTDHTASKLASFGSVLSQLAAGGYCNWHTQGTELVLLAANTGTDHSLKWNLTPAADSVRRKTSTQETASVFYVVSDQPGVQVQKVTRPELGAGPRQAVVTVSGAKTAAVALRMATPLIDRAAQVRRELTVIYQAGNLPAAPLIDFQVGDLLSVHGTTYRLVGVQVQRSGGRTTVRLTFGERFLGLLEKLQSRAAQISFGSVNMTGGSGQPITPANPAPNAEPSTPTGLTVTSNVGGLRDNGQAFAAVTVSWSPVTTTVTGADTHVTLYEVWEQVGDGSPVPVATVTEPQYAAELDLIERNITVRAYNGAWSDFSAPLHVVPGTPPQVTAPLTMPIVESAFGVVIVQWDGLNATGNVGPEFNRGFVEYAGAAEGPWTRHGAAFHQPGQVAVLPGLAGLDMYVRFVWEDTLGRIGLESPVAQVTVVGITPDDLDSIPDFFANLAVIERARIGILQAGVVEVDHLAPNVGELINITANEGLLVVTERVGSLEEAAQFYRFGPDGAIIGRVDDPVTFEFRNDEASFNVNGVPATTWSPEGMDVPKLTSEEAVVGNLQFERSGNRTVVRVVTE
jgi:hypothetical protein